MGITQSELARRVSRAQSWVSGIENDSIPLDSIALINTLARVLRVHPNELTARPYRGDTPAGDRGHSAIPEIRRHLERYDLDPEWVGEVRPLPELRAATEHSSWLRRGPLRGAGRRPSGSALRASGGHPSLSRT
ncbi:helix-turn-helix domain-containing protein [Streptosporangium lutulentum]